MIPQVCQDLYAHILNNSNLYLDIHDSILMSKIVDLVRNMPLHLSTFEAYDVGSMMQLCSKHIFLQIIIQLKKTSKCQ